MKRLVIQYSSSLGAQNARIRFQYRSDARGPLQEWELPFRYHVSPEFWDQMRWYYEDYLLDPWGNHAEQVKNAQRQLDQVGQDLYNAVFSGVEQESLSLEVVEDLPQSVFEIALAGVHGAEIPWELMRDGSRGDAGDLARISHGFSRSVISSHEKISAHDIETKSFNILYVQGPHPTVEGRPCQPIARHLLELCRPFQPWIQIDFLRPATPEELARRLAEKSGHYSAIFLSINPSQGNFLQSLQTAIIESTGGSGGAGERIVSGKDPLILIDSCQSGIRNAPALVSQFAQQLLRSGISGVVALPYAMPVKNRARFWAILLTHLVRGEELIHAVNLFRQEACENALRQSPIGEIAFRDWYCPMLYANRPVRFLLPSHPPIDLDSANLKDQGRSVPTEIDCIGLPASGFCGRHEMFVELEEMLLKDSVVLIQGPAGAGKTELALNFSRWWAETQSHAETLCCFNFKQYVPLSQVCDRLSQLFDPSEEWASYSNSERQKRIISYLRENPCILIWDNFQSVAGYPSGMLSAYNIAEQKSLRDFLTSLRGGKTLAILTSRRDEPWLGEIYGRMPIEGLPLPEAQDLAIKVFKQQGFSHRQIKNLAPYNHILQQSHGNPLALQMVLPELRRNSEEVIHKYLPQEPHAGPGRVFAYIAKARFETLDPIYKKRLAVIGIFREHVAPRVLAAISSFTGVPELIKGFGREEWIRFLDSACEMGLLRRSSQGPYSIPHALDRSYFNLLLEVFPDDLDWLEKAFYAVCGRAGNQLFQIYQADKELALALLSLEQHNLMHAYRLARQHKDWDSLKEILCGLRSLLITQGRWTEWDQIITGLESEVLEIERDLPSGAQVLWFRLLGHRAEICEHRLDKQQLVHMHQMLKNRYSFLDGGEKDNEVLDDLGAIANHHGMLEEAERFYLKSLAINQQSDDQAAQAQTCERLGELALKQKNYRETEKWFQQALAIWESLGETRKQADVLKQLEKAAMLQEKPELAHEYGERAKSLSKI